MKKILTDNERLNKPIEKPEEAWNRTMGFMIKGFEMKKEQVKIEEPKEITYSDFMKEIDRIPDYDTTNIPPRHFDISEKRQLVLEKLKHYIPNAKTSELLIEQLVELEGNGYVTILGKKHPYNPDTIYGSMSAVVNGTAEKRPFNLPNSKLYGLNVFHSHHSESFYIGFNWKKQFKKKYDSPEKINNRINELRKQNIPESELFSTFVIESTLNGVNKNKKSGQWVIYQVDTTNDTPINFICLYLHNPDDENDEKLFNNIKVYLEK